VFFIGVDPGTRGAVAIISDDANAKVFPLNKEDDLARNVRTYLSVLPSSETLAAVEDLHAIFGVPARTNFVLGWSCGYWHGVLNTLDIPVTVVAPKVWQGEITTAPLRPFKPSKKELYAHKKALKAESIRVANELFPNVNTKHDGVADALCIAAWLRYRYNSSRL
jgi:hypothetical protein